MTLSNKKIEEALKEKFVCGWKNIKGEKTAGQSHEHAPGNKAANVNNGSGFRNVQIFVMTPEGHVVHCLPGFWKADLLLKELEFALTLVPIWQDEKMPLKAKAEKFMERHLEHLETHTDKDIQESDLPRFDQRIEKNRKSDTSREDGDVKKADQIVHERMAERPFVEFSAFDTAAFTDVGDRFYDAGCDGCQKSK